MSELAGSRQLVLPYANSYLVPLQPIIISDPSETIGLSLTKEDSLPSRIFHVQFLE